MSGPNVEDKTFFCWEKGDTDIQVIDKESQKTRTLVIKDVLISKNFPFHIYSEINAFSDGAKATKVQNHWQFYDKADAKLFSASQQYYTPRHKLKVYFIDEAPATEVKRAPTKIVATSKVTKISMKKNDDRLLDLHILSDHRNFRDLAEQFDLQLPDPLPLCWACLMAKPKHITPDKTSERVMTRIYEGMTADAKGPMTATTPQGFEHFFVIVDIHSTVHWVILAKSTADWANIWPQFVKRVEARTGKERCISLLITDCHKVHTQISITQFNDERGIQSVTSAPYSQWQNPAESGIKLVSQMARTSMIRGGAFTLMWGWAVLHAQDSINLMRPSHPVPGFEGKCRSEIVWPSVSRDTLMRRQKPFLSLVMKTIPTTLRKVNFEPRATPCVNLHYDTNKKSWAMLTLPDLILTYAVDFRHVPNVFPLRVSNNLATKLYKFLAPAHEEDGCGPLSGPDNIVRRQQRAYTPSNDESKLVPIPVEAQQPRRQGAVTRSTSSSTSDHVVSINTAYDNRTFTPDDLAKRTPTSTTQALQGRDSDYWLPGVLKDFRMLRDKKCFTGITDVRPHGPTPLPCEQRFKIKHRSKDPVKLSDLAPKAYKVRTVARGDRCVYGVHFENTAAPVAISHTLKMLLAWGVAEGLMAFQFDESDAFYSNIVDIKGIIVKLPPGFDPDDDRLRPLDAPPLFAELVKSLPGLPQGSIVHYDGMVPDLAKQDFKPAAVDPCLFVHGSQKMAIAIHVDDGILMCPSLVHATKILGPAGLGGRRKLTWGPLLNTLGIQFDVKYTPERRSIFMHQHDYAVTVLRRAGMYDANLVKTPAVPGRKYTKSSAPRNAEERKALAEAGLTKQWYHTIVASLNFLTMITRDDMRFVQGKNAKYCADPGLDNFNSLKHQLRFLKGTTGYGIEFIWNAKDPKPIDGPLQLQAYSDSSYADDIDTGRTTLGTLVKTNGATTSSSSKLSYRVDSCVNHSELNAFDAATIGHRTDDEPTDGAGVAFLRAGREVTWARGVKAALERRDVNTMPPTPIFVDNAGVLAVLQDKTMKFANKHIYKTAAENRERVNQDKIVVPVKIHTNDNLANALTKQEPGLAESAKQLKKITGPPSADAGEQTCDQGVVLGHE